MTANHIGHIEISANNRDEAKAFYSAVFGWEFQDFEDMNYTLFTPGDGGPTGGFSPVSEQNPAGTVMLYLYTETLSDTMSKIAGSGGTVVMESMEIPTVGTMGVVQDPTGNVVAVMQPLSQA
jgi:hypothetical protein